MVIAEIVWSFVKVDIRLNSVPFEVKYSKSFSIQF